MITDNTKDSARYIVNTLHHGGIRPGNRAEMWRDIYLDQGAFIKGSIFGNNLTILNCGVEVEESVYVRGEIKINLSKKSKKEIVFHSSITSPDSLITESNSSRVHFNSDIYVNKINIENSIIYGNVYCTSAILKNCIILGGVYAKKKLNLENCIIYTFDVGEIDLGKNVSMLSPLALSNTPIHLKHNVKALTFYSLDKNDEQNTQIIAMDEHDVFELRADSAQVADSKTNISNKYLLSVAERVLNATEIIEAFRFNKKVISYFSLAPHLEAEYAKQLQEFKKDEIETQLWDLINKNIDTNSSPRIKPLKEVINRLAVN